MATSVSITKKMVKPFLDMTFPEYTGRKFKVQFVPEMKMWDTNWSGGTKNEYKFVSMSDSGVLSVPSNYAPWSNPVEGVAFPVRKDIVVVCHSYFCGKDTGITLYAHPSNSRFLQLGE